MFPTVRLAAVAAGLFASTSALAAQFSLAQDAKAFGARESLRSVELSPSGTRLLYIGSGSGRVSVLQHVDLASKTTQTIAASDGNPEDLYWCAFGSDTQLVCKFGGYVNLEGDIAGFSRLVTLPSRGGKPRPLGERESYYTPVSRQYDGDILDWMPGNPGSVLMQRTYAGERNRAGSNIRDTREGLGVDRIDLASLRVTPVESATRQADSFMTDGRGTVRIMGSAAAAGEAQELTGLYRFKYRAAGSKDWRPLVEYDMRSDKGATPIAVEAESNSAFLLSKLNGRDALYRIKLDGSGTTTLVAANQQVDIDDVVRIGRGQRVIGYTFATEGRDIVYFDPEYAKLSNSLAKALGGKVGVTFEGASGDGSKLVVFASSDTDPGTYYLLDRKTKRLDEIAPVRPALKGRTLAPVQHVAVPAPDGVNIPAYLTLPVGGSARNLPAIVLPHGGPSARDEWGFDWLAQFLAARGYAVIQPNYRGSAGYGEQWEGANGFKEWEKAIADISASARYLTAQGIADPKRLAILGWSYGGYAALQSAAVEPDLYKAAVAIAPVTDLSLLKRQAENFTSRRIVQDFVGSGTHILHGSPAKRASSIKAPVLLVHGDLDANVHIRHSEAMVSALNGAGKSAELIRFKGLDHQLDDSAAREQMLNRIGAFLGAAIGN